MTRGQLLTLLNCIVQCPNAANVVPLTTECMTDAQLGELTMKMFDLLPDEDRRHVLRMAREIKAETQGVAA